MLVPGADDSGFDFYAVATKLITQTPLPVLLSGGVLSSKEYITGVAGFDDDSKITGFANAEIILEAKARLGLHRNRFVDVASLPLELGGRQALAQAQKTFEAAATLVKNDGDLLPLKTEAKVAVFSLSSDWGEYFAGRTFANAVKAHSPQTEIYYADADTGQEYLDESFAKSAGADVYVCALFSSLSALKGSVGLDAKHTALIKKLKESGKPVVAVSFGSPYFLGEFPSVDAYLCLYRNQPQGQITAVKAIYVFEMSRST